MMLQALLLVISISPVLVERDLPWTPSGVVDRTPATLLIFDETHEAFVVETHLWSPRTEIMLAIPDLDPSHYRLYCGRWTTPAADKIAAQADLLASTPIDKGQFAETFTAEGNPLGPVRETLRDGSRIFQRLSGLRVSGMDIDRFRHACHGRK